MAKIILTKEQDSDLQTVLYRFDYVKIDLIKVIANNKLYKYSVDSLLSIPKENLINAILNGYEVQKTKEEKAKDYIKDLQDSLDCDKMNGEPYSPYEFALKSVEKVLNILEIKL